MEELITLKSIIDDLQKDFKIPVGYISFRQAYIRGSIPKEVTKFISKVKKFTSVSYYVEKSDVENFTEALIKHFN